MFGLRRGVSRLAAAQRGGARLAPARRVARCFSEAPSKVTELCDGVCQLNVIEMKEFLDLFKERAGLTDADLAGGGGGGGGMMMAMPAGAAAPAGGAAADEAAPPAAEKEYFDIKIAKFKPENKIKVIKEIRAITGLGLKEAKDVVEGIPQVIKKEVKKDEADAIVKKLVEIGCECELE